MSMDATRCEGRYPVPETSPRREEPFPVTYRCGRRAGHSGPHAVEEPMPVSPETPTDPPLGEHFAECGRFYPTFNAASPCTCGGNRQPDPPAAPMPTIVDAAEMLWVVLANVSGGDWTQQAPEWQEAAALWRDNYFAAIKAASAPLAPAAPTGTEERYVVVNPLKEANAQARQALKVLSPPAAPTGTHAGVAELVERLRLFPDRITTEAADTLAQQATQLQEAQFVAKAQADEKLSERDRRVAAQEAITLHWEPKTLELEQLLSDAESQLTSLHAELDSAKADTEDSDDVRERLASLLTRTAIALRGEPEPLHLHDWSDLPKRVEVLIRELAEARRALDEAKAER